MGKLNLESILTIVNLIATILLAIVGYFINKKLAQVESTLKLKLIN